MYEFLANFLSLRPRSKIHYRQLLDPTQGFDILGHSSKYLPIDEKWRDIEKISAWHDNGTSNRHCPRSSFITEESYISFLRKKDSELYEVLFDQYSDLFPMAQMVLDTQFDIGSVLRTLLLQVICLTLFPPSRCLFR